MLYGKSNRVAIIEISKTYDVITPGLNIIIGDTYRVSTTKSIYEG